MKKILKYVIIFMLFIMMLSLNNVEAHNVELDPKSYITMPAVISNGIETKILISGLAGANSDIYYQHIMLSDAQHKQIQDKNEKYEKYISESNAILNEELSELNTLKEECEKIINSPTATEEEKEAARTNYNNKVDIYNNHVDERQETSNELLKEYNALIPSYVEGSWKQASEGKVNIDFSNYNGTIHFVLWAKLVVGSETYYDLGVYSSTVTNTTISLDKTTATIKKGETITLKATVNTDDNVTWSSNKTSVATVDANGVVKGIAKGVATITATANNKTATCTITVTDEEENKEDNKEENDQSASDFSKATFKTAFSKYTNVNVKIENAVFDKNCSYYLYISKGLNENRTSKDKEVVSISYDEKGDAVAYFTEISGIKSHEMFETTGDNYVYIIEKDRNFNERIVLKNYKLEDVTIPEVGQRLDIFLYDAQKTMVSNLIGISSDRKITYKIGKITSKDILRTFKNDSSTTAYKKLLDYAKTAEYIKTGATTAAGENFNLVNDIKLEQDAYYFVYMIAESENGKYKELEDVAIYIPGLLIEGNTLVHFTFSTINVDDEEINNNSNVSTQGNDDKTTANTILPHTGVKYIILITMVLVIVVGFTSYKRYKKII